MILNSSGILDIFRVLNISHNTVLENIRKEAERIPEQVQESCIIEAVEIDEQWYVVL